MQGSGPADRFSPVHAAAPNPPYALDPIPFRLAALAAAAGHAPLGGKREVTLAVFVAARLAHDTLPERCLSSAARGERAAGARHWLSMLALPSGPIRPSLTHLVDATASTPRDTGSALENVIAVTDSYLDPLARADLDRLAAQLAAASIDSPPQALVE